MRVAIPIWGDRVSPVLDVAREIAIIDLDQGQETDRSTVAIYGNSLSDRIACLKENNINCLLCGAVSNVFLNYLSANGIEVYPWLVGRADDVLQAFIQGRLSEPRYMMPGCYGRRRRRGYKGDRYN